MIRRPPNLLGMAFALNYQFWVLVVEDYLQYSISDDFFRELQEIDPSSDESIGKNTTFIHEHLELDLAAT